MMLRSVCAVGCGRK